MEKSVTFIGNPNDNQDAKHSVVFAGHAFILNQPKTVDLSEAAIKKLEGNSHFKVKDAPKKGAKAAEDSDPDNEPDGSDDPPADENVDAASDPAKADGDERIQVRRAQPRSGKK